MFIGRQQELNFLETKYKSNKAEFIVLYGRRRICKTETLKEFCKNKKNVFYAGHECTNTVQLEEFSKAIFALQPETSRYFDSFKNWFDAFSFIADYNSEEKIIVVIDEFPYVCKGDKSIPSILQNLWDHRLKELNIMLIISGSSVSFIEDELLGAKNPLYGRATGIYKMEPMPFEDAVKFFPNYSNEDKVLAYSILGGIPHYLMQFNPDADLETNIREQILTKGNTLYDEVEFLLHQELRETAVYNAVIQAIALGNCAFNDIYNKVQIDKPKLSVYLKNLIELGIVVREFPVMTPSAQRVNVNRGEYRVTDNFFRFWYAYIYSHYSDIEAGDIEYLWNAVVKRELHFFASKTFETMAISYMRKLRRSGDLPFIFDTIGRWWGKVTHKDENGKPYTVSEEIDVLAADKDEKNYMIGECKFTNEPFDLAQLKTLQNKLEINGEKYWYLFSLNGFTDAVKDAARENSNIQLVTLDDMLD